MQSVSSGAVYSAIGGHQIKTYANQFTLYNSQTPTNGYILVTSGLPPEIQNSNVIAIHIYTGSISALNGFQITPIYASDRYFYFTFYKPASWAQQSVTFTYRITYIL